MRLSRCWVTRWHLLMVPWCHNRGMWSIKVPTKFRGNFHNVQHTNTFTLIYIIKISTYLGTLSLHLVTLVSKTHWSLICPFLDLVGTLNKESASSENCVPRSLVDTFGDHQPAQGSSYQVHTAATSRAGATQDTSYLGDCKMCNSR